MAGKFINTNVQNNVNKSIQNVVDRLDNKYIAWLEEKPTPVIFYNINMKNTTFDEGSKLEYSHIGDDSPFRYDKINGLFCYGLQKIMMDLEETEFGMDIDDINGEMTITPDTIVPLPNAYFKIPYLSHNYLFKVTDVQQDTLNNGSNYFKIVYALSHTDKVKWDLIEEQVVETFDIIYNNIGTDMKAVVKSSEYSLINKVDDILIQLKLYFKSLFYNGNVQSFIFMKNGERYYDPYLIEFMIKNALLTGDGEYIHVGHQTAKSSGFILEYDSSIFRCFEKRDLKNILNYKMECVGELIRDICSIFSSCFDDYFKLTLKYPKEVLFHGGAFYTLSNDIIMSIISKIPYTKESDLYKNIFIKFFNNADIELSDLECINYIEYAETEEMFYHIPLLIFCLEFYIKTMLSKHENNK